MIVSCWVLSELNNIVSACSLTAGARLGSFLPATAFCLTSDDQAGDLGAKVRSAFVNGTEGAIAADDLDGRL